jgi:hypothetical protein
VSAVESATASYLICAGAGWWIWRRRRPGWAAASLVGGLVRYPPGFRAFHDHQRSRHQECEERPCKLGDNERSHVNGSDTGEGIRKRRAIVIAGLAEDVEAVNQ